MRPARRRLWHMTALLLVFFGVEQALGMHTWADRHEGVSWTVAYLPFLGIAAMVWFEAARLMAANRAAQLTFGPGIAGWLGAGVRRRPHRSREALPGGELLEMPAPPCCCSACSFRPERSLADQPPPRPPRHRSGDRARCGEPCERPRRS